MATYTTDQLQQFLRFHEAMRLLVGRGIPEFGDRFAAAVGLSIEELEFVVSHRAELEVAAREAGLIASG